MEISCTGLGFEEGKVKYDDEKLIALKNKFNPKKFVPFYVNITIDNFVQADLIAISKDRLIDLLILDIEKCETRKSNSTDDYEKEILKRCLDCLEDEIPLCKGDFDEKAERLLCSWTILSIKPVLVLEEEPDINKFIAMALIESNTMMFYTAWPNEVHAWHIKKDSTILECAAKIHSDLAKGFIKGDVISFEDFMICHNMNDAISKGLAKMVDRDHIVNAGDVIEIRCNL